MSGERTEMEWVVLTEGRRPGELNTAVASLSREPTPPLVLVIGTGTGQVSTQGQRLRIVEFADNLGVPGGRHRGVQESSAEILGFLDDDAVFCGDSARIEREFADDPRLGAVALRLVDEEGNSSRRHTPRVGSGDPTEPGEVADFLGGACAIRREAYEEVGGYFTDLFYGHEEIELSWRLIDAGWTIRYLADVEVFHPRTEIGRHLEGWRFTGRNRVWDRASHASMAGGCGSRCGLARPRCRPCTQR